MVARSDWRPPNPAQARRAAGSHRPIRSWTRVHCGKQETLHDWRAGTPPGADSADNRGRVPRAQPGPSRSCALDDRFLVVFLVIIVAAAGPGRRIRGFATARAVVARNDVRQEIGRAHV